jgi:Fe-S oxidoreductase
MGCIDLWARMASIAPGLFNRLLHAPPLAAIAKSIAGLAPQRDLPPFARRSFQRWHRRGHERTDRSGEWVVLWPDTFTNFFHPEVGHAAVEVLEHAGLNVWVPPQSVCCGRPLYDFGMLDRAKRLLRETLGVLRPALRLGAPVIVLEPSCAAVFRDELQSLFPDDRDARLLGAQTRLFSDFVSDKLADLAPQQLGRRALFHGHCHQKALFGVGGSEKLLERLGVEHEVLDAGCCGLAGSFGYEAEHYEVSMKAGERVLLPRVREADGDTFIVADGFSCRSQIAHGAGRRALHTAEVAKLALGEIPSPSRGRVRERVPRFFAASALALVATYALAKFLRRRIAH